MNSTQIQTTAAPIVAFLAGLLAGKGVFGLDAATWATVIGAIFAFGATIWGAVKGSKSSLINATAAMPEVQSIKLEPSAPAALESVSPANVSK